MYETRKSYTDSLRALAQSGRKICVYGMGNGAEKIIAHLKSHGITVDGVFASDAFVRGQSFLGMRVLTKAQAEESFGDFACVTAFALHGKDRELFRSLSKRHTLFAPNLPPYGEGCVDRDFLKREKERMEKLRSLLADEDSVKVFDSLLLYDLSADINDIYVCDTVPEGWYRPNAVYLDIGAYDGDTALGFASACPDYEKIYAFEPDAKNYKKLCANVSLMRDVECVNAAAGEFDGVLKFVSGKGRGGGVSDTGREVRAVKIDHYVSYCVKRRVTNIKCDAEGHDMAALCGAVNTVYTQSPAVKCAVYHRAGDILDIPLWLADQLPGARLYLRSTEYIPAFDVFAYAIK